MKTCPACSKLVVPRDVIHEDPDGTGLAIYYCGRCEKSFRFQTALPLEKMFLLAGDIAEYLEFLMKYGLQKRDVAYLTNSNQLDNVRFVILRYGAWASKPNNLAIVEIAERRVRPQEEL